MGFFDNKTDYERGREDSAKEDPNSVITLLDDLANDVAPFTPPDYRDGWNDGVKDRKD